MLMMDQAAEGNREELRRKLRENFDGRIVRKDLTKKIKEGANVPVYVLEFLLGQYCSSDDEEIIEQGVQNVKHILADNFVRPDEAQKVLSQLRRNGSHTIIDMVTVHLDIKKDCFFAEFSNLGLSNVPITDDYPEKFDRLLCGGIWCIVQLEYESEGDSTFGMEDLDSEPRQKKQKENKSAFLLAANRRMPSPHQNGSNSIPEERLSLFQRYDYKPLSAFLHNPAGLRHLIPGREHTRQARSRSPRLPPKSG